MPGTRPPIFEITDTDHGGYVAVALYTLLSLMLVTVVARLFTRWFIGRRVHSDDIWLAAAAVLGVIQSIMLALALHYGLGMKINTLSPSQLAQYFKYEYVAELLLIATVACSKVSIGLLFKNLMTYGWTLRASQITMVVIGLWAVASMVALAFQCDLPHPWKFTGHCIDRAALYQGIGIFNILTDISLVVLPCTLLRTVQLSKWKRSRMMGLLATRLVVCIATGFQMYYATIFAHSSDPTWTNIEFSIWDVAMMNLSIITAAIPSLGRLVIELQPNIKAFTINENGDSHPVDGYVFSANASRYGRDKNMENILGTQASVHVASSSWRDRDRDHHKDDSDSTDGLVKDAVAQNVIQQTIHFEVH